MTLKDVYADLVASVESKDLAVFDTKLDGPGVAFDLSVEKAPKRIIVIDGKLKVRDRIFVLSHEIGHLFFKKGGQLFARKTAATEQQANDTACKILAEILDDGIVEDYIHFYNTSNKNTKRREYKNKRNSKWKT